MASFWRRRDGDGWRSSRSRRKALPPCPLFLLPARWCSCFAPRCSNRSGHPETRRKTGVSGKCPIGVVLGVSARPSAASAASAEDCGELVRWHALELGESAIRGRLVAAPATKLGGVPEAAALHVVVGDLDHELGAQRFPR